jgi:predicted nucleotidyltransferase
VTAPITPHQARVAGDALDAEERLRKHLVISLTGAHAYGFSSPDSDLDLKGVHVEPTGRLVGLARPEPHASRLEVIEGVEIDYASNEIGQVLAGLLRGFGSYYERVLGMWPLREAPELAGLVELARGSFSRRVHAHYRGFASSQYRDAEATPTPTAKKLLYVLRTALTGAHLLATGRLVTDLNALVDEHGFGAARELLEIKRTGERAPLPADVAARWMVESRRVFEILDAARAGSPLPEEPPNGEAFEPWLVALRRAHFD